jgi:hypothetical protein
VTTASVLDTVTPFSSSLSCSARAELSLRSSLGIQITRVDVSALCRNGGDSAASLAGVSLANVSQASASLSAVGEELSNGLNALQSKRWYTAVSLVVSTITHACLIHLALPCESCTRKNSAARQTYIR